MSDHDVCGCGTLHEAYKTALGEVELSTAAGNCMGWQMAVTAARFQIMQALVCAAGEPMDLRLQIGVANAIQRYVADIINDPHLHELAVKTLAKARADAGIFGGDVIKTSGGRPN